MSDVNSGADAAPAADTDGFTPEQAAYIAGTDKPVEAAPEPQEAPAAEPAADGAEAEQSPLEEAEKAAADPNSPRWFRQQLKRMQEEMRALRDQSRQAPPMPQQPATPSAAPAFDPAPYIGPRPDPAKYDAGVYDPEYSADLGAWKVKGEIVKASLTQQQAQRAAATERLYATYHERAAKFAESVPDYEDVAHTAPISDSVADIIREAEAGPAVAYWLGKNRAEAERISGLSPRRQAIEIGRIEARLEAARSAPKAVSNAPPPVSTVRGRANPAANSLSPDLPMDQWAQNYRKIIERSG